LSGAAEGTEIPEDLDLQGKSFRRDFYLTKDSTYRILDLAKSCNISTDHRSLSEVIEDLLGQPVLVEITQRNAPDGESIFNDVGKIVGN
jgi:hypothetical protein